jgi:NarL family two-component system sensor histidine kinase LiaS
MITPKMTNIKWKMLVLFGLGNLCVMSGTIALMVLAPDWMRSADYMLLAFAALLISGLVVGYFAVKSFQRSVDSLHFGIIQLSKGDMKIRLPIDPADPFQRLFDDFNHMAQSIERQVHLLHKTGEENVRLQAHTDETAVIEERKRLARDLHDTVSQHLFAIHMSSSDLSSLKGLL